MNDDTLPAIAAVDLIAQLCDTVDGLNHEDRMFAALALHDLTKAWLHIDDTRQAQRHLHACADRLDWVATERDRNTSRRKRLPEPAQLANLEALARDVDALRRNLEATS